jgi:hypothetical protein
MPPNKVIPMTGAFFFTVQAVLGHSHPHPIEPQPTWPTLAPSTPLSTATYTTSGPVYYTR